jgi:hypothetical protein
MIRRAKGLRAEQKQPFSEDSLISFACTLQPGSGLRVRGWKERMRSAARQPARRNYARPTCQAQRFRRDGAPLLRAAAQEGVGEGGGDGPRVRAARAINLVQRLDGREGSGGYGQRIQVARDKGDQQGRAALLQSRRCRDQNEG